MTKSTPLNLTNQIIQVIAVAVGLVILNLLSSQLTFRVDLTHNQLFSISSATEDTLKNLDDLVTIKFYQSANIPTRFQPVISDVNDMLATYDRVGKDKLNLEHIIIDNNQALESEAKSYGLQPLEFNIVENDQYQVATGFLGLVMIYGDQIEIIPALTDVSNLEYELTSRLLALTQTKRTTIGFTTGHDEWSLSKPNGIGVFVQGLQQQHVVTPVKIDDETAADLSGQADILVVVGPKQQFSNAALYSLDQYIMSGRPVIFLADGVLVDQNLRAQSADHNLYKLLTHYGVTLNQDLVADKSFQPAFFQTPQGSFQAPYPLWVRVSSSGVNPENPVVNSLNDIVIPWVSSLTLHDDSIQTLFSSTSQSYLQPKNEYVLDPTQKWKFATQTLQAYPLAVIKTGHLTSYFTAETASQVTGFDKNTWKPETNKAFYALIADGDLIRDIFIRDLGKVQNAVLVANLVDSMLSGDKLIGIRSKSVGNTALIQVNGPQKTQARLAIFIIPFVLISLIAVWYLIIVPRRIKT